MRVKIDVCKDKYWEAALSVAESRGVVTLDWRKQGIIFVEVLNRDVFWLLRDTLRFCAVVTNRDSHLVLI